MDIQEIRKDFDQMKQLIKKANRPKNKQTLTDYLKTLQMKIKSIEAETPKQTNPPKTSQQNLKPQQKYIGITKYAWDQQGVKVKIIISLDKISQICGNQKINISFSKQSLDVKIHDYNEKNYRFPIDPQYSKYLIKTNSLNIVLIKKQPNHWQSLNFKENKIKPNPADDQSIKQDPSNSLMNMMKKMYQEGDDQMKKTIAQAWTKAQQDKNKSGMPM